MGYAGGRASLNSNATDTINGIHAFPDTVELPTSSSDYTSYF